MFSVEFRQNQWFWLRGENFKTIEKKIVSPLRK